MNEAPVTALLLGGPKDGELMVVPDRRDIVVAYADSYDLYRWGAAEPVSEYVNVTTKTYRVERISLFGVPIEVWVYEDVTDEEKGLLAAKHLLSPIAKRLSGGRL